MQTNRFAALVLTAALCLGTAACGSSDGDDAATTTTEAAEATTTTATGDDTGDEDASPEKAAFLEAADKICKESTDAINEQTAGLESQDLDDAAFEEFLQMAAEESTKQITAVRELGFPEADSEELDAAFTVFEEAFAKVAEDPANTLEYTSTPEFQEASTFLTDYGFEECGGSGE
jgi:Flp pilus assembly protein TadD